MSTPSDEPEPISELLAQWNRGDNEALNQLVPFVYEQMKKQARRHLRHERQNHTLQTSAVVHEAYLKLAEQRHVNWENRAHFFWLASEVMRRVLVDHARKRNRQKRGDALDPLTLNSAIAASSGPAFDLLELDSALTRLSAKDPQQAKVVELRYFAGCSIEETANTLHISEATVKRDWTSAKAWLLHQLRAGE
ncbi:MAG TPA: sigma-70 family RNA polymerase sigma factor [Pyrinomonadaceae bacterium]|nr:sigma-70 family RNA polymerase sigma factor [Pyrinomonadaceae bacterium]